ncbi:MAG TPA: hypothetical protein PLJ84_10875 [Bacteroidales bacterium]|mgnify:CR=1 FL=1|nr:hypothetical protein [Bacteroidales bacterium]
MPENKLSIPQKRSLFAAMKMIEKSMNDLGDLTGLQRSSYSVLYDDELSNSEVQRINDIIHEIRSRIKKMFEKYDLDKDEVSMEQVVNSKKAYLWTILEDSTSKRMKGYGNFPVSIQKDYDNDIQEFMNLISLL